MNDPLKKFIDHNRDDFDDLEPSPEIIFRIKDELKKGNDKQEKLGSKFILNRKWLVAASLFIVLFAGYMTLYLTDNAQIIAQQQKVVVKKAAKNLADNTVINPRPVEATKLAISDVVYQKRKVKAQVKSGNQLVDMQSIYTDLADSTSSGKRMAAILKIQQSGTINYDVIDKLAKTLDADNNSNVRLAALSLMGNYIGDSYIGNKLINAINTQKEPIVQLELIELLQKINNPKLDDKLYALANDPNTFTAVKDQAYLVLLNQNKL